VALALLPTHGVKLLQTQMTDPEPVPPTEYSKDGVDLTLIRWMLSLTPAERLQFLQRQVNAILAVRNLNARQQVAYLKMK
jgi:hypothetical protein